MNETMLDKIRKLLALAERAGTEAEASAASEAAERLIAKYAIDIAMLQDTRGDKGKPSTISIPLVAPYEKPKALLVQVIAEACGCRSVWQSQFGRSTVVGFESDLETVQLLFASLSLQATNAALREGAGQARVRAFRNAFLLSFATRVGQRLREIRKETVEATTGAELVLRDRSKDVALAYAEAFPDTKSHRSSTSSHAGANAGRSAANMADLGQSRMGTRRSVTA